MHFAAKPIPPIAEKYKARFWDKVEIKGPNDCWIWTSDKVHDGYGTFNIDGRTTRAHRIAFYFQNGPFPPELHVCHRCDVRDCVNPAHLFLGNDFDNMGDAAAKGRIPKGSRNANSRLKETDIPKIREMLGKGISQDRIAACFGVNQSTISSVHLGITWKHV